YVRRNRVSNGQTNFLRNIFRSRLSPSTAAGASIAQNLRINNPQYVLHRTTTAVHSQRNKLRQLFFGIVHVFFLPFAAYPDNLKLSPLVPHTNCNSLTSWQHFVRN